MGTGDSPDATRCQQVTLLLNDWSKGDKDAGDMAAAVIYSELHNLAESHLRRERDPGTLQPTVLVHEAYLRLVGQHLPSWQNRHHFYGIASRLMRQILVDHARERVTAKRGGGRVPLKLNDALDHSDAKARSVVALDDALRALAATDPRKAQVIELRYFGGLTVEETAEALAVSVPTIVREARYAEAWLRREMQNSRELPGKA
jgi:RNA polymerase sigma factor (TIGR02999 family)